MKRLVKIIIIFLILNGLVFVVVSLVKIKNAAAQQDPDPLTFYCQLEEDYINYSIGNWQETIAEFAAGLAADPSDPDDPPGPPPEPNPGALAWPVSNPAVGHGFGHYEGCVYPLSTSCWHGGLDLNYNHSGDSVYAAADGTVIGPASFCSGNGTIKIRHDIGGKVYITHYYHLSSVTVSSGQDVNQGQQIGTLGNTCCQDAHLHFALIEEGASYFTNPCLFLPGGAGGIGCSLTPATCGGTPGSSLPCY